MRCKLNSTENPRSFEKYPIPPGGPGGRHQDTKPVDFEPVPFRTGSVNLAPKSLYQIIVVNFILVLIRIINYLLYVLKPVLLLVPGLSKT